MGPQVSKRGRGFERKVICCAFGGDACGNSRGTNVGHHRRFGALKENATDLVSILLTLPTYLRMH